MTSILDAFSAATSLLSGWFTTAQEPIHLSDEHSQHPLTALHALQSAERVSCRQDTVGVDARLLVQSMPDDRRKVEQNRLYIPINYRGYSRGRGRVGHAQMIYASLAELTSITF